MGEKRVRGDAGCILHLNSGEPLCFSLAFHSEVTSRASWYAPPDMGVSGLQLVALERVPSIEGVAEILMNVTFSRGLCRGGALLRPKSFRLLSCLSHRGKSPEKPKGFFWSVQGSLRGNRNPLRLFFFCQRFLLEKQKKMLKGSHKPVQSISLLIDFRFPLLQSKFLPSIPSVSLRLTAPLAARGAGGFFFPL